MFLSTYCACYTPCLQQGACSSLKSVLWQELERGHARGGLPCRPHWRDRGCPANGLLPPIAATIEIQSSGSKPT